MRVRILELFDLEGTTRERLINNEISLHLQRELKTAIPEEL